MTSKDKLKQQQEILRGEIRRREAAMQQLSDQLEENFGRVILNSVLPVNQGQRHSINQTLDTTNSFLSSILGGSQIPGKYDGFLKSARMIAAGIAWKYIRKLFTK